MRKIIWVTAIMVVVFSAFPAAADFYVIGTGGNVGTKITSVPYTISSPGLYCLAKNLAYSPTSGNAITVAASDVTLDLMGFSLTGPGKTSGGSKGIYINSGFNSVEIRNGSVSSFGSDGISGTNNEGTRLIGLRVMDNGGSGVNFDGDNQLVMGCLLLNNAVYGATINNGLMKGNQASFNGGRGLIAASGVTISGNVCHSNGGTGIYAYSGSSLLDNTTMHNNGYGIYAYDGSTVMRNTSRDNNSVGIRTNDNCLITNNTTQGLINGVNCTTANNCVY